MNQANNIVRVLLVDDDEDDFVIVKNIVSKITDSKFKLSWAAGFAEATDAIKKKEHDIYLVDYRLGSHNGIELLQQFDLLQREEPFIILTGAGDERVERVAMKMGAADYLVKGTFDDELLSRVMRYSLQRKHLEAQRIQQLIELNRSKDEFIALASHQLRTPATAVKQYVGMILEGYTGEVTEQQRAFLENAYESNERQINVVNDMLRIAQLDLKKVVLNKKTTDIGALMGRILQDAAAEYSERKQTINYTKPKDRIRAVIDAEQIRMALSNIVDNASKYTPEGKSVTVSVAERDDGMVAIQIKDEGVGIAKEDRDKLFKKFSRIHNPLSVEVGGTGLGLYWANEVVLLHNGRIEVDSEIGKGTAFNILLPQAK